MKFLFNGLDERSGYRAWCSGWMMRPLAGGAGFKYVLPAVLLFLFFVEVVTGLVLWTAYSPSTRTAWESIFYTQHIMTAGWVVRGLHHYTNQALLITGVLFVIQLAITGFYRAPRELIFLCAVALALLLAGLSITGELLPWDAKTVAAAQVRGNIVGLTPYMGEYLKRMLLGGSQFNHHSITRFFTLHAGILPVLTGFVFWILFRQFRRHGQSASTLPAEPYWPGQAWRDGLACLCVMGLLGGVVYYFQQTHGGPPLYAPADLSPDPSRAFPSPRPPWYFLFLYEFLNLCEGQEMVAAVIVPSAIVGFLLFMPFLARWRVLHVFNNLVLIGLVGGVLWLTIKSVKQDLADPAVQRDVRIAHQQAARAKLLATHQPIGFNGAIELVRNDPLTRGPELFKQHCANCHRYGGEDGLFYKPEKLAPSAPDLKGFATREWLRGVLDPKQIDTPHYFGNTGFNGENSGAMVGFVKDTVSEFDDEAKLSLQYALMALSAQAKLSSQANLDSQDKERSPQGEALLKDPDAGIQGSTCHKFGDMDDPGGGPELTGYGSREWLAALIRNPYHDTFYDTDHELYNMPAFGSQRILSETEIYLLSDWLRGDWFTPPPTPE